MIAHSFAQLRCGKHAAGPGLPGAGLTDLARFRRINAGQSVTHPIVDQGVSIKQNKSIRWGNKSEWICKAPDR
jgi:hypothetical protein